MSEFNGLGMNLGNLSHLSNAQTRSISAENFTGEKGKGGMATEGTTPFLGMHQVVKPDGTYHAQHRHAMYRWHIMDPVRFQRDVKVEIQALGWRSEGRYYPGTHDICSVAYWYQTLPTSPFPAFPCRDALEIV